MFHPQTHPPHQSSIPEFQQNQSPQSPSASPSTSPPPPTNSPVSESEIELSQNLQRLKKIRKQMAELQKQKEMRKQLEGKLQEFANLSPEPGTSSGRRSPFVGRHHIQIDRQSSKSISPRTTTEEQHPMDEYLSSDHSMSSQDQSDVQLITIQPDVNPVGNLENNEIMQQEIPEASVSIEVVNRSPVQTSDGNILPCNNPQTLQQNTPQPNIHALPIQQHTIINPNLQSENIVRECWNGNNVRPSNLIPLQIMTTRTQVLGAQSVVIAHQSDNPATPNYLLVPGMYLISASEHLHTVQLLIPSGVQVTVMLQNNA